MLATCALALSFCLPLLDEAIGASGVQLPPWILTTTDTARATLSTMASAMIAVTGTVFSITIVTLSLTSQQFGPRLLRRFMYDLTTQATLGVFVSTGFYCLLLLRVIESSEDGLAAPHLSVFLAILLAILSMVMLIVFIHHVAMLIQAPNVVAAVGSDLDDAIIRLFPESAGEPTSARELQDKTASDQEKSLSEQFLRVPAKCEGYVQAVAANSLVNWASENNLVVRLCSRPGDFITINAQLAEVWPAKEPPDEKLGVDGISDVLNDFFIVGIRRTPRQDVECAVNELVEIAVRALSPGINDPFTAMNCIDRLGASLGRLAERQPPSPYRCDEEGRLRVIARPTRFSNVLGAAFNQIRQSSQDSVAVTIRILEALVSISQHVSREEDRAAIMHHAKMVVQNANTFSEESDRQEVMERFDRLSNRN